MKTTMNITYPAFALFAFACFALLPSARATCEDGCDFPNDNTFLGWDALVANTTGTENTGIGSGALMGNTGGGGNTAIGFQALSSNTEGMVNTATGAGALFSNDTGSYNTATGVDALQLNETGSYNTATGVDALQPNTTGSFNTATGAIALFSNDTGNDNTATGFEALENNTAGHSNTATGSQALENNSTGDGNTAAGESALLNTTGSSNTATGASALRSNTTGSSNIAVGFQAGIQLTTGSHNIDIGNAGRAGEANTIRIGRGGSQTATFIAGIRGVTTGNANAIPVLIDSAGQLGTASSSRRFKKEIKPMDQTSEAILGLKPVTFHYKSDSENTPQFGLIAEEVAEVNADLIVRDENGEIYTVRYEAVNAMLLNEFLKAHRKIEEQGATIAQLKASLALEEKTFQSALAEQQKQVAALVATIKEQAATIQKVSDRLEATSALRVVANNAPTILEDKTNETSN